MRALTQSRPVFSRTWLTLVTALLSLAVSAARADAPLPTDFVYLRQIDASIGQDIHYAGTDNFTAKPVPGYGAGECLLVRAAALSLAAVQKQLATEELGLQVYDCYRPVRATDHFMRWARQGGGDDASRRFHPHVADRRALLAGYIARRSRHSLGIAVDLTLVQIGAAMAMSFDPAAQYGPCDGPAEARAPDNGLDMGTGYDCFAEASATASRKITPEQRARRRRLVRIMAQHGWWNYPKEWWHFEYKRPPGIRLVPLDLPIRQMPTP